MRLGGLKVAGLHDGEIDVGLCDHVDEIGQHVFRDEANDFKHLSFGEASSANRCDIRVADMTAPFDHSCCEADGRISLRVAGIAPTIEGDFLLGTLLSVRESTE